MGKNIQISLTNKKKEKPDQEQLGFGRYFTDHMFVMDYSGEKGWHEPRIVPYAPLTLDPASKVLHYGQTVFEGLKAYKTEQDQILLFRPDENMKRINRSSERLSMPLIDEEFMVEAIKTLVNLERDWVPSVAGTSLYIRPFMIATDAALDVQPSSTYQFVVILSPVGAYYEEGINPVKIYVENEYVRAVKGGTGYAKTAGNYASGLKAQEGASKKGYSQVLWLDGIERKYIEEVGSMNVFFKINGEVVTPASTGSLLEGITRKSVIQLLQDWGVPVQERKISIEELYAAYTEGKLEEAFGTGTAAVISPIGELCWDERKMIVNDGKIGELALKLYDTITGIQYGKLEDRLGWTVGVE